MFMSSSLRSTYSLLLVMYYSGWLDYSSLFNFNSRLKSHLHKEPAD